MTPLPVVTDDLLSAFLACRYKGYLKQAGQVGTPYEYEVLVADQPERRGVRRGCGTGQGQAGEQGEPSCA